jgi:HlyD family secretion protein
MKSTARKSIFSGWGKLVLLVVIAAAAYGGWRWYSRRAAEQPIDYKTAAVGRGDLVQIVTANGVISPVTNVTVGSQVSGIITDIKVDFNSQVTNGQVVAQIDPSTYQQNITQAEADLANAKAGWELTRLNQRRAKELLANQLISQSDFDKADVDLLQADAVMKMRAAALNRAKVDLERTTIYAPIDGIVISRNIDRGQTVAASFNTPTLFQIANDLRQMRIEAMVSEADVGGVQEGQRVTFLVDAFPGRQFAGKVTQVRYAPITNQNVVNYTTVVEVNNSDLKLRPGMTANASIITAEKSNVLRVPNAALRFRPMETALPKGMTNKLAGSGATNLTRVASSSSGDSARRPTLPDGVPTPPWVAEGRRPTQEERQKWMQTLTPEQQEQVQRMRDRMRSQGGEGGGFGGSSSAGSARSSQEGPAPRVVYVLDKAVAAGKSPGLKPVTIKTGITDGAYTEVIEGLNEGDSVVVGVNQAVGATAVRPGGTSPFGGPFGGMRPPR